MSKYIDADKLIAEIEKLLAKAKNEEEKAFTKKDAAGHLAAVTKTAVCVKIKKLIATLQQEQLLRKSPISWMEETKKELQHEEELLDMRLEALKRIREKKNQFKQEQLEVDLDAIVDEAFDKYSSVDGYGQLAVSFNRAELYSFIKKIARNGYDKK